MASENEISKLLQDLPNRIICTVADERQELFQQLSYSLSSSDVTSAAIRSICKILAMTLTKYKDNNSQLLVRNLIIELLQNHHDAAFEGMMSIFKILSHKELANAPLQKASKAALIALGWTSLLNKCCDRESNVYKTELPRLIEYQSILYQIVLCSLNERLINLANNVLIEIMEKGYFELYMQDLIKKEPSSNIVVFMSILITLKNISCGMDVLPEYKEILIDFFIKGIITAKSKPHFSCISVCKILLNSITKIEFENKLLPPMQRSMLRNPELILQIVGLIIGEINIDFSQYALTLGKVLIQYLHSKDEISRTESVESLKYLSMKCSDVEVIAKLLNQIFAILNGVEGKITVAEYRINIIQGAGFLSFNAVCQSSLHNLFELVLDLFSKTLNTEVHEKVICFTLEMFSLWIIKYTDFENKNIIEIFKKGVALKTSTQHVRLSYLQWLLACFNKRSLDNDVSLIEMLLKIVEKGLQNPLQIPLVSEAVCASCLLLKIDGADCYDALNNFWIVILDINKSIFFTERLINSAPADTLCYIILMAEQILTKHIKSIKGSLQGIFKALVQAITSPFEKVRSCVNNLLPELIKSENGVVFAKNIIFELGKKIKNFDIDLDSSETHLISKSIVKTIHTICDIKNIDDVDSQSLALDLLMICHHPLVVYTDKKLWEYIVKECLNLEISQLVSSQLEKIVNMVINNFEINKTYENAVATLSSLSPDEFLPFIINKFNVCLSDSLLINITDNEYFTFLTPEGELYDKSVIPNSNDTYTTTGLKRENKVYSYKEQIEELQLRREIEEKKRKEGKLKPPQLTPKQKEAIKNQTEKEQLVKMRLKDLNLKLKCVVRMLESACEGNAKQCSLYFPVLLRCILEAMKSPLAAESLTLLYYQLRSIWFEDCGDLGFKLAIATIRLQSPRCDLSKEWNKCDLKELVLDTLYLLKELIIEDSFILSSPAFTYVFEFLKRSMILKYISDDEKLINIGIHIIEQHAQTRGDTKNGDLDDYKHPKYLPRLELLQFLIYIISTHSGRVQNQAVAAILEVAKSSSGDDYCALATQNEIHVFLDALENGQEAIRDVALRVLTILSNSIYIESQKDIDFSKKLTRRLWLAKFDISNNNRIIAENLWNKIKIHKPLPEDLLFDVIHSEICIQKASAASLVPLLIEDCSGSKRILKKLLTIYNEKLSLIPPKLDEFDREVEPAIDQWKARRGVAIAISKISQFFSLEDVNHVMQFMVSAGLGDREEIVHKEMLASALTIVDLHGKDTIITLLPVFEDFLDKAPKSQSYDNIRQAVVILMGSLARHLEKDDKRIEPIVRRLLTALSTPSQQVQEAVANCLPHLMPSVKEEAPVMIKRLLQLLVKSEKYGERRGAAYGIAGIVKGLGILSLKQFDIMSKLTSYIQEKKNYKSREGALFAFEILCTTLGRLFEPYIVHVLPHLLQCFGDSSQYVRQAADDTAKVVMGKLSAHGVKLVLPSLLEALDEDSWRTKTASVELLGAMAYCAPKQLSSCLPSIVPKLIEVLGDSHTKVQEAGADALKVIGSVIKNPEIQAIVPVLLKALEDPSKNTSTCLQSLLQTKFVHFIDAPSLALIMPVVQRAFMDRSTETRKMAAQIIGNMYSLTDQKDLTPYLPNIIPGLKMSLLDPVPEVRAVSARALGAMVRGMGESSFEDLLPWLMQTLTSETSSVDRSGAAQGLSEVVGGLGVEKLHKLMPEIIATAERSDIAPHVKDGYIMMFIYMPGAFPQDFTPYIGQIINPILKALADENEYVRDTALKAGQRIVNLYAETAVTLLLPELEKGLFDDNWRIRFSSVQLLGDLLYRISGVSGKMTTETASEDDNFGTEQSHTAIIRFLGIERRNRVLSGLYMGRSDVSLMVRQAALHVWKVVVTNTPRTLREILPTLFSLLLGCLASTSYDKRQVAARTLGDLVRKLGERVLPEIIPILERGLNSEHADQRQGVCIGLSEIMASTSKEMVLSFVNSLVPTVRKALSDPLPEVREAAAKTFESLHSTVGSRALDDILPSMLEGLSHPDPEVAENTLDGLRQVMTIKSRVVLPYLVPQLTAPPVNTKALSILVSVAGDALTKYLPKILFALLQALSDAQGTPNENQELEYCQVVILSVADEVGIRTIMDILMASAKSENLSTRKSSSSLLSAFCMHTPGDYSQYVPQLLRCLLRLMAETDRDILQRSWDALNAVVKGLDSSQQIGHVSDVRQAVRFAASDSKSLELPGFCLPKGITPLLPVFREAILNGLPEEKENAAQGLGEIILITSAQSLQPSVVHITGPLIRILGDRFNAGVKAAVLETLAILLHKVGVMLKQFLPQLQTTFLKALHDQNRLVRMKAGHALSELVLIHSRADPLFNEIHNSIKSGDDSAIRETMLQALRSIISPAGDKMSETLKKQICSTLLGLIGHQEDVTRSAAGGCLGALFRYLPTEQVNYILQNHILLEDNDDSPIKHGRTIVLFVALKESTDIVINDDEGIIIKYLISYISSDKIPISSNGIRGATYLIEYWMTTKKTASSQLVNAFTRAMNHNSNEIKQLVAKSCNHMAKNLNGDQITPDLIKYLIPMLVNGTKEKNGYVKSNSEIALISLLRLRENEQIFNNICQILDSGARDSLSEVVSKVLRKAAIQPAGKDEELDDTLLIY
ncbi:lethal (3) 80Fj [Cochliomyia hominivorax]